MSRLLKKLQEILPAAQRGDGGIIYIVFIMFIIIAMAFVMVGGLNPEFDDLEARENAQSGVYDDPNDKLPPLPNPGTPEYELARKCAEQARKGKSNEQIAKKGELKIDPDCPQAQD